MNSFETELQALIRSWEGVTPLGEMLDALENALGELENAEEDDGSV